jgi:hypothetical protein
MIPDVRRFPLGVVLSVTTGITLAPIDEIHELLDFMTGDSLFTHQLPRASRECAPVLLARHPHLADVVLPESFDGEADVLRWVEEQTRTLGEGVTVATMDPDDHTSIDPIVELVTMRRSGGAR